MFAGKLLSDPEHADELIVETAKDGVKMIDTMATTVTNPEKMVHNLNAAVEGVGENIKATGLFRAKRSVRTYVDAVGECHGDSILYRCKLRSARSQNNRASAGLQNSIVTPMRHVTHDIDKAFSASDKAIHRAIVRTNRSMQQPIATENRTMFTPINRPVND